jgi:hypothetical protein
MSILDKFTVVDLFKTHSDSVATVGGNALKFNRQTAEELQYAPFVQILLNTKDKQFAIRVCKEDAPKAVPFSKEEGVQKYAIRVTAPAIVSMIQKMAGWDSKENWNIRGVFLDDEEAIVYDCNAAQKPNPPRGGWNVKRQRDAEAAATAERVAE